MCTRVLPSGRRGLPWAAALLLAALSVALWSPRTAAGEPLPDVVVTGLTLAPATARAGDSVTATVTLQNQGNGPAGTSLVSLYLGTSSGSPLTSALRLGTLAVDGLAPRASQQVSSSFTVAAVVTGSFSVIAVADGAATLAENNETNNRRTAGLRVTIADLTVSRVTLVPSRARIGDTVTATVVIYNAGQVPANASTVRLHFETASGVPASVIGAGLAGPLAARESRELSFGFTVPSVPLRHSYYVWAHVDPDGSLFEANEGNNRRGAWLELAAPDLTVSRLAATPTPARAGDPITVTLRVRNQGSVPAEANEASLYVTTASNAPLDGLAPVATIEVPVLTAGRELQWTQPVPLPVLSPGHYYLVAVADSGTALAEDGETNNRRSTRFEVAVPTVTVDALGLAPSLVHPGQSVTASVRIRNRGRVSSRPTTADVFLATSDSAALLEGTSVQTFAIDSLRPGASVNLPVPLIVPLVDPGAHYVIAQVNASTAGGGGLVASSSAMPTAPSSTRPRKSAKLRVSLPDLTLTGLGVSRSRVEPNASVALSVTVRNVGAISAPPSSVGVYRAEQPDADKRAAWALRTLSVPALAANASAVLTTSITIPTIPEGSLHLLVIADPGDSITESVKANNRMTGSIEILAGEASPYGVIYAGFYQQRPWNEIIASLDAAAFTGARWIRLDLVWANVEFERGQYYWDVYDQVLSEARRRGLDVLLTFYGTPDWAVAPELHDEWTLPYPPRDPADFGAFVQLAVARYRESVSHWEVWNEPDGPWFWKGTPKEYAELLARAYDAIKATDPDATVLLGGLAQGGGAAPDFLEAILADPTHPAGQYFDVLNYHTNFRSMGEILEQIKANRDALEYHALSKRHWVTETSYTSDPLYQTQPGYQDGEVGQARYLVDAFKLQLDLGVERMFWAQLKEDAGDSGEYAHTGLVTPVFQQKRALSAYRELATDTH